MAVAFKGMTLAASSQVLRLGMAAALLFLFLILPNHPSGLTWSSVLAFPLELPAILLGLTAAGKGKDGQVIRLTVTGLLVPVLVLKTADLGMFAALSRSFNPVADLPLIDAGLRLLAGTVGMVTAVLAAFAAILLIALLGWLVWWATGVWSSVVIPTPGRRAAAALASVALLAVAIADVASARNSALAFNPPGTAFTVRLGLEKALLVQATLADLKTFEKAAASDPFSETTGLFDLIDGDMIVVFVESYGRTSHDTPLFADAHLKTLKNGQARLSALGLSMASGYLASPTRGGQSWLAHSTFANGLWISDQTRYRASLISGRQTLFHLAARSGFHTAAVMPQITMDWPESAFLGFDTVLAARDLGYRGKPFNWVTMPDQFTFAALERLLLEQADTKPRFIQIATGSSHAPWVPVPQMVAWEDIGDGTIFNEMATAGDPPDVVWRDNDRVRAQYGLAIDYALQTVLSFAERHAENPPLMIILGDHQAAGFVALDERTDVPIHVIGPAHLVARVAAFAASPGLIPARDTPVVPMDQMRDLVLRAFSSAFMGPGNG